MNESTDLFERELASLQPQQPSPELRKRIEHEFRAIEQSNRPSSAAVWSLVITAVALAACLLLAILPRDRQEIAPPQPLPAIAESPILSNSLPTFWAYHGAVTASPQTLDNLLDRHAGRSSSTDDSLLHVHAFRPFHSQNQSDRGGL